MGYVRSRIVKITWEDDPELAGLEIRTKAVPLGKFLEFEEYAEKVDEGDTEATKQMLELFSSVLVSWNVESQDDEDAPPVPVPATLEGLYSLDMPFVLEICLKWMNVMAGVSAELGKASTSGVQFPEGSIPMDIPSLDLEQLTAPI